MATMVPGKAQRQNVYGAKVERAAATLPATATQTIFNVSTGRILLTTLVGEVVTATGATVTTIVIDVLGTASAVTTTLASATAVTSLTTGTEFSYTTLGGAATVGSAVGQNNETIIPVGAIRITTSATNTGTMRWTATYIPLDDGASLAAA